MSATLIRLHEDLLVFSPVLRQVVPGVDLDSLAPLADPQASSAPDAEFGLDALEELGVRTPDAERYRFRAVLGRGGAGVVLAVFDAQLRREVAMKLVVERWSSLAPSGTSPAARQARARFVAEARIASRLDHPGIVPVYELGADPDGRLYFTMKIVGGEDLAKVYERVRRGDRAWPVQRALGVLLRVCETMEYAHDRGAIHRDLKPSNVMVGPYGEVYVTDWGLARWRETAARVPSSLETASAASPSTPAPSTPFVTAHGSIAGTPCYMSPEQARGEIDGVSPSWDVYALGAMLYELLGGAPPYATEVERPSVDAVLAALERGAPRKLEDLASASASTVAPELRAICERAMQRDPRRRYASMAELAADLRAYLEGRVVVAHDASAWAQARKWVLRNRALAASIAGAIAILVVGLAMTLLEARRANAAETDLVAARGRESAAKDEAEKQVQLAQSNAFAAQARTEQVNAVVELMQKAIEGLSPREGGGPHERRTAVFDGIITQLESGILAGAPVQEGRLWSSLNVLATTVGDDQRELEFAERALERLRSEFGDAHPDVAAAHVLCGLALTDREGRSTESLEHLETAVEIYRHLPDEHAADLARATSNLGFVLNRLGRFDRGLEQHTRALELRRRLHSSDHVDLAASLANIGQSWQWLGQPEQTLEFGKQALEMLQRLKLDDTPQFAQCSTNIGVALGDLERHGEALEFFETALDLRRRIHEGDHPEIAQSLSDVGHTTMKLGRYARAKEILEEALAHARRLYGDEPNRTTAECLNNLGGTLMTMGANDEALVHFDEALAQFRILLPGPHSRTAMLEGNVALSYLQAGQLERAEAGLRRSVELYRQIHAGDHPELATALCNLAGYFQGQRRFDAALELLQEVRAAQERQRAPNHPDVSNAYSNEGGCLQEMGRLDEAQHWHERALELRRSHFGERHPLVARSLLYLANLALQREQPLQALPLYEEAASILVSSEPFDALEAAGAVRGLGHCLLILGRCREALERFEVALELRERHLKEDDPAVLTVVLDLASTHYWLENFDSALPHVLRAAERAEALPTGHPTRSLAEHGLEAVLRALDARK